MKKGIETGLGFLEGAGDHLLVALIVAEAGFLLAFLVFLYLASLLEGYNVW